MSSLRGLAFLPWPVRVLITAPVAITLIYVQYTAYTGQRSFEAWQEQERSPAQHTSVGQAAEAESWHIGATESQGSSLDTISSWALTLAAAGGAGLTVLGVGLALFSLSGGLGREEASAESGIFDPKW